MRTQFPGLLSGALIAAVLGLLIVPSPAIAQNIPPLPNLPNGTIVYLIDETVLAQDSTAPIDLPNLLQQTLGAQISTSWEQVVSLNQQNSIDALIIDATAIEMVDQQWVSGAYRQGVVIAGLDIPIEQFSNLVGNDGLTRDGFASELYPGRFFIITTYVIQADYPEDAAAIMDAQRNNCGGRPASGIRGSVVAAVARSTESLDTQDDFNVFAHVIADHLEDVETVRQDFARGTHLQPIQPSQNIQK